MALFYTGMAVVSITSLNICHDTIATQSQFCAVYSRQVVMVNAAFNLVSDVWILILPFPHILKLQLHSRQKISLAIVFAAGLA